jgi:hypothetical protein
LERANAFTGVWLWRWRTVMEEVVICRTGENDKRFEFRVSVIDNTDRTIHDVSLSHGDYDIFALRSESPERFVERCLEFLLERLPKDSIRSEFDIGTMAEYFPDFAQGVRGAMMHHLRPDLSPGMGELATGRRHDSRASGV